LIVVSDTSPVLNLARIGRLELLRLLCREVLIPFAVYRELTDSKRDLPPAIDLASMPWLIVAAAANQNRVQELRRNPDPGEAEAIVRAIQRGRKSWFQNPAPSPALKPGHTRRLSW
jgi:predicted nucleic acid-binding protein